MTTPTDFRLFAPPDAARIVIEPTPRLESWMRHDHPDQVRLREYLWWLVPRVAPTVAADTNTLAMTIAVPSCLPRDSGGADLDNYLFPVVRALGHARFVSVWASKVWTEHSTIAVAPARLTQLPDASYCFASAETSEPKDTAAWKRDIDAQVRSQVTEAANGPVEIQVAFIVEPHWNWAGLWKPAIDALGAIVGQGARPFNTRDDRIVKLALHRTIAARVPRRTSIGVWWRLA